MDAINANAIAGLTVAITELLANGLGPGESLPVIAIVPLKFSSVGLSGYVATHPNLTDPIGEIVGRRLDARVSTLIQNGNPANLLAAVATVTQALVGSSRGEREQRGILKLDYRPEEGMGDTTMRELVFRIVYEHLEIPTEAGDVIETIPSTIAIAVEAGTSG